jgi:hypothetical protein
VRSRQKVLEREISTIESEIHAEEKTLARDIGTAAKEVTKGTVTRLKGKLASAKTEARVLKEKEVALQRKTGIPAVRKLTRRRCCTYAI